MTASGSDHFPVIFAAFLDGANQLWDPPNVAPALMQRKPDPPKIAIGIDAQRAPQLTIIGPSNGLTSNHFTRVLEYFACPNSTTLDAINALELLDRHTCRFCDLVERLSSRDDILVKLLPLSLLRSAALTFSAYGKLV